MSMIREYEGGLKFNDYVTEGAHGRTGVFATTDDYDIVREKAKLGWSFEFTQRGFWLRAPDISLVDITEPFRIYQMGDGITNLSCFKYLRDLRKSCGLPDLINGVIFSEKDKYSGFDFYVSEGEILEGEVRIGGSDSRVHDLKADVLNFAARTKEWQRYLSQAHDYLGRVRTIPIHDRRLEHFDQKSADFIRYINGLNHALDDSIQPLGMQTLEGLIEQLPDFEVMILVPTGCYRYITSLLREDIVDRIMLWEVHIDPNQPRTYKLMNKNLENRKCLIVDKSYTGKTLTHMADLVRDVGGVPIRFGLFPKSRCAVKGSEYVLFLDRVLESGGMNLGDENWPIRYYKEVLSTS